MQDPFETLGVSRSSSDEDITAAYRRLARQYHPDRNPGDKAAEEKMKEVNAAYDAVRDIRAGKRPDPGSAGFSEAGPNGSGAGPSYGTYGAAWGFPFGAFYGQTGPGGPADGPAYSGFHFYTERPRPRRMPLFFRILLFFLALRLLSGAVSCAFRIGGTGSGSQRPPTEYAEQWNEPTKSQSLTD